MNSSPAVIAVTPERPATATGLSRSVVVPSPSWPSSLSPQQRTVVSARRAHVWVTTAATWRTAARTVPVSPRWSRRTCRRRRSSPPMCRRRCSLAGGDRSFVGRGRGHADCRAPGAAGLGEDRGRHGRRGHWLRPGRGVGLAIAGVLLVPATRRCCSPRYATGGAAEGAEIDHPARLRPRKRVETPVAGRSGCCRPPGRCRSPHGLAGGAAEGAEVVDPARLGPGERVVLPSR